MLVRMAQSEGGPTAALVHGSPFTHATGFRTFVNGADHMMLWGPEHARVLAPYGLKPENSNFIGTLRYGDLYRSTLRTERGTRRPTQIDAWRLLKIPDQKPSSVLLTASVMGTLLIASPAKHRETLREIVQLAARRPDLNFVIKPHPGGDYYELYRML